MGALARETLQGQTLGQKPGFCSACGAALAPDAAFCVKFFVILFLTLQQVEGNLVYPRVVGKAGKDPVAQAADFHNPSGGRLGQEGVESLAALEAQFLL